MLTKVNNSKITFNPFVEVKKCGRLLGRKVTAPFKGTADYPRPFEACFVKILEWSWRVVKKGYDLTIASIFCRIIKKKLSNPSWSERRLKLRKSAELNCQKLAKTLHRSSRPARKYLGLPNPNNRCYLNASIQSLEAALYRNQNLQKLLQKNLSLLKGETLIQLESRLLKDFAPIIPLKGESAAHLTDRILFKWSFLLLLQAKKCGNCKAVAKCADNHFKTCFAISLQGDFHGDFREGENDQKDAAAYVEMWYDILQMPFIKYETVSSADIGGKVHFKTPREESMSLLQLSLYSRDGKINTELKAEELLNNHFAPEQIDEEVYETDGKEVKVNNSVRSTKVVEAPDLLVVHFKRFGMDLTRLNNTIDPFVNDQIDLSKYTKDSKGKSIYNLASLIVHNGDDSINNGHYISYVKGSSPNEWYKINDQHVETMNGNNVPKDQSYLALFYRI